MLLIEKMLLASGGGKVSELFLYSWGASATIGDGTSFSTNNPTLIGNNVPSFSSSPVVVGNFSWTQVSSSSSWVLAIRSDGRLFSWGNNPDGQLGLGDIISRSSPVQIGTSSWSRVSAGRNHALAIDINGRLFGWGRNLSGALGDGTSISRSSPVQIGTSSWTQVSVGEGHNLAIDINSRLFAWGLNTLGVLGNGTVVTNSSPVQIGASTWSQISASYTRSAGITTTGQLFIWGSGQGGSGLGNSISYSSPVQIGSSSWSQVSAGYSHIAAIRSDGSLFTWGYNLYGVLGTGNTISRSSPVQVGTSSWTQVTAGRGVYYTSAIRVDGLLFTWGSNNIGQIGDGTIVNRNSPVQIGTSTWSKFDVGASGAFTDVAYAIDSNGRLYAWGSNLNLGFGIESPKSEVFKWSQISSGGSHNAAIRSDGLLFTWGLNSNGELGDGTRNTAYSPVQIGTSSWTQVSAGQNITAAIRSDGRLFTWGTGAGGGLGDGTVVSKSSPVQIGTSSWTQVRIGTSAIFAEGFAVAIRSDGRLFTWGTNESGLLGDLGATTLYRSSPVQIGTSSWTQVSVPPGQIECVAAIRLDGRLFTWGNNGVGQLGDSTLIAKSSPVQIGTSSWTQVSASNKHIAAIRLDGRLFIWGNNDQGELGDGTGGLPTDRKSSPVQLGTNSWYQVSAGRAPNGGYTFGIRRDDPLVDGGPLFSWGSDISGQLGLGGFTSRSSPVQVGSKIWSKISAGNTRTLGITKG